MNARLTLLPLFFLTSLALQGCSPLLLAGGAVGAGAVVGTDRRTAGTLLEDQAIEIKATDRIYADEALGKRVRVRVTSFNRRVLLTGEVPTAEDRGAVLAIVKELPNVAGIYNEIRIGQPAEFDARSKDTWMTTKVRTKLALDAGLPNPAKAVVSGGTVYLMGLVDAAEAEKVTAAASQVEGVQRVVRLFEYLDGESRFAEAEPQIPADLRQAAANAPTDMEEADIDDTGAVAIPYAPQSPAMLSEQ